MVKPKPDTAESSMGALSVPERVLLFCAASGTDWERRSSHDPIGGGCPLKEVGLRGSNRGPPRRGIFCPPGGHHFGGEVETFTERHAGSQAPHPAVMRAWNVDVPSMMAAPTGGRLAPCVSGGDRAALRVGQMAQCQL